MRKTSFAILVILCLSHFALCALKPHLIAFGKWTTVKCSSGNDSEITSDLKVRGLFVDTRLKEYTSGLPHEVTDRLFVVRRAFRVNDSLPQETGSASRWLWQRGGWLLVDRLSGRVSQITLPLFTVPGSEVAWYRDYAAYCGYSDDGKNLFAMVIQLGRRKPVLKKAIGPAPGDGSDSDCGSPEWQRLPMRVTFVPASSQKLTFAVRGGAVSELNDADEEDSE
jgi:hypothetical protein